MRDPVEDALIEHLRASAEATVRLVTHLPEIAAWAQLVHRCVASGGKLLCGGNGGSAALGAHLSAELVGRYAAERRPFSAISLTSDDASFSAVANDYGYEAAMARAVRAHGRPRDVVLLLSTSGNSPNVVRAAVAARDAGATALALTGPGPSPLSCAAERSIAVDGATTAVIQEAHQVVVHLLCELLDRHEAEGTIAGGRGISLQTQGCAP